MRALTALLVLAVLAAAPASARAQEPLCRLGTPDANATVEFQKRLGPYLGASSEYGRGGIATVAAEDVLGPQFTMLWADNFRQGWTVAYSPGPHDATTARAAIRAHLAAGGLGPATVDYLDSTLLLVPTPYSLADLESVRAQVGSIAQANGPIASFGIGCAGSDAVRLEIRVVGDTPELRAQVDALLAPFGDKVRVTYGHAPVSPALGGPPVNTPRPDQRPTPKVREYVSLPKTSRCVKGGAVSAKPRISGIERVRLQIGKRTASARGGKAARLRLKSKRSTVTVTVFVKGAVPVTEKLAYRRCA